MADLTDAQIDAETPVVEQGYVRSRRNGYHAAYCHERFQEWLAAVEARAARRERERIAQAIEGAARDAAVAHAATGVPPSTVAAIQQVYRITARIARAAISEIQVLQGECDCKANGCPPSVNVSIRDDQVVVEVHGLDNKPGASADLARAAAALMESVSGGGLKAVRNDR